LGRLLTGPAAAAIASVFILTAGCLIPPRRRPPPEFFGPASGYQNAPTEFVLIDVASSCNLDYVVDWGDGTVDTILDNPPGDTIRTSHAWTDTGDYDVRAMDMATEKNNLSTEWSPPHEIEILPNGAPIAYFYAPKGATANRETEFAVWGTDQEGEDVSLMMRFGDEESDWSEYVPSGESAAVTHVFENVGETLWVSARARDVHGALGPWSDSVRVVTVEAGGVLWWWERSRQFVVLPPVIGYHMGGEYIYVATESNHVHGIGLAGGSAFLGSTLNPGLEYTFSGGPAFSAMTGRVLVGADDGRFYAFNSGLAHDWTWLSNCGFNFGIWSTPAVSEGVVYVGVEEWVSGSRGRTVDRIRAFPDMVDSVPGDSVPYYQLAGQEMVCAPVVDDGQLFFLTDSGYLCKLGADFGFKWRVEVGQPRQDMTGPVLGLGIAYAATADGKLHAISTSNGSEIWSVDVPGAPAEMYTVVGQSALYVATDLGHVVCLNLDGSLQWDKEVTSSAGFDKYPILAKAGYMYVQDDADVLHCLSRADGSQYWEVDCVEAAAGQGSPGPRDVDDAPFSPTLTSTGDIILVADYGLCCVSGYSDGTLDTDAPWPKWQHDLHNTGNAGNW
jgi:outer membrane protein assembly factor BamB